MSYDLWFWNQTKKCSHRPETVVRRLCEGGRLTGIESLDLDAIEARLIDCFPKFRGNMYHTKARYFTLDKYPPYGFQIVSTPPQDKKTAEMLNKIIDVANEFGCALYDPQSGQRYNCK